MSPRGVWGCSPKQLQSLQEVSGFILKFMRILHSVPSVSGALSVAHVSPLSNSTALPLPLPGKLLLLVFICLSWGFSYPVRAVSPGGCAPQWELRRRWWADAAGAVVPPALQEVASAANAQEEGLAGGEGGLEDPPSRERQGCGDTEASERQA